MDNWAIYLHENGDLISKARVDDGTVSDMKDSDFVRMFWIVDPALREDAWNVLIEANMIGANKTRISELSKKWGCNDEDAKEYASRFRLILEKDGTTFFAHNENDRNVRGHGSTALDAFSNLAKALGFKFSKFNYGNRWYQRRIDNA